MWTCLVLRLSGGGCPGVGPGESLAVIRPVVLVPVRSVGGLTPDFSRGGIQNEPGALCPAGGHLIAARSARPPGVEERQRQSHDGSQPQQVANGEFHG